MKIILDGSDVITGTRAIRRYTFNMIKEFVSGDYDDEFTVFLNCFWKDTSSIDNIIKTSKRFSKLHCWIPRSFSLPYWKYIRSPSANMFRVKSDIFHALGDDCPPVRVKAYISTLHGIAYISRPDLIENDYVEMKTKWLKRVIKWSDYFISVSNATKQEFLATYPFIDEHRVETIPLGVGQEFVAYDKYRVKSSLDQRFNLQKPYLLYVGGLQRHKNILGVINAFELLAASFPDLHLLLVGEEKNEAFLNEAIKQSGFNSRIDVLGYISPEQDDLPLLYNGAECFVFPTFTEGWTSPPLESMACGTPVVTSNVSSLPETVGDAALKVNPDNPDEIAEAIQAVLTNSTLRQSLIQKGLQRATQFTWKKCAEKTYRFYQQICQV